MKRWMYLLMIAGSLAACCEDETIIPGTESEKYFTLPQGNHDYDDKIVEYYEKYGFYILYDFTPEDVYWTGTNWDEYFGNNGGNTSETDGLGNNLMVAPASPDWAGEQLAMCENLFFNYYPDSLLKCLPLEFFLCSQLYEAGSVVRGNEYVFDTVRVNVYRNFHCMAVNGGSQEIDTMGREMKMEFQTDVNAEFLTLLSENGMLQASEEFEDVCDYKWQFLQGEALFAAGYLTSNSLVINNVQQSKSNDFAAYLKMLAIPLEILEGEPAPISIFQQSNPPLAGALHPDRDVNGLVRKKYEILLRYFKERYGIKTEYFQKPNI